MSLSKRNLDSGQLLVTDKPMLVTTVLGSCVAVIFYNSRLHLGAICHALQPQGRSDPPGRFVDHSIAYMMFIFNRLGVQKHEIIVKLFGGAGMFNKGESGVGQFSVGEQNVRTALEQLDQAQLKLKAQDVGGCKGRLLLFDTTTGIVYRRWTRKALN